MTEKETNCKNIFKSPPTKEQFTRIWIELINALEHSQTIASNQKEEET